MKHVLEGSKLFPFIAWGAILFFITLTYFLAVELQKSAAYLGEKTEENIAAINSLKKQ